MVGVPAAVPTDVVRATQVPVWAACAAVFLPGDPPRTGRVGFWSPNGSPVPGSTEQLTVVRAHGSSVRRQPVLAALVPLPVALPVLIEARRMPGADPAAAFWGAAGVLALQLMARGRLLPGVSAGGFDAWRIGPYDAQDMARLRVLGRAPHPFRPDPSRAGLEVRRAGRPGGPGRAVGPGPRRPARRARRDQGRLQHRSRPAHLPQLAPGRRPRRPTAAGRRRPSVVSVPQGAGHLVACGLSRPGRHRRPRCPARRAAEDCPGTH